MAAASLVFRSSDPYYSLLLLQHAEQLFEFGDKYRGKYDGSVRVVKSYYPSVSGYYDELLWAALWLHRATGTSSTWTTPSTTLRPSAAPPGPCRSSVGTSSMPAFRSWPPSCCWREEMHWKRGTGRY
uniref:cellulase n=1 Tax=Ananas comosus var. bracteatus TaxID=296719 RepID=A0A6V7Q9K9_ANACO|nr:unnamed protein product [Ananas comosus var. bracteatus]